MRVAIIGGGICGSVIYLNLRKHVAENSKLRDSIEITIYEAHTLNRDPNQQKRDIPSSGGGYGLAPNGMASLRRLDPEIHDRILRGGFPSPKTTLKSARGWVLGTLPFVDTRGPHVEACVMILRQTVLDTLYDHIPESAIIRQKVVEIEDGDECATIELENGERLTFDLVIGADGIWSKTRRAVLQESYDAYAAIYKGLFTVGGFVSSDCLPSPPQTGQSAHSQTVMTFGPNAFFGYTPFTTGEVHVTEEHIRGDATLRAGQWAFWWSRSEQKNPEANPDDEVVKDELRKTHKFWKDPTIHKILEVSEVPLKIPTWVLPKLPKWAGKRVVLAGDAAHALPSSSGQGVSQAIEDAEALSLLLAHNLDDGSGLSTALEKTFEQYAKVRKAHVEKILDAGNRAGDTSREMGPIAEIAMYSAFWLFLKLFGAYFIMKPLRDYDVVAEVEKAKKQS